MREITLRNENGQIATITSLEVAEMVNKRHTDLMRDIRRYLEQLAESKIALSDFFTESNYKDSKRRGSRFSVLLPLLY